MKILRYFSLVFVIQASIGAVVKKPPAFSTPTFSDSYLPAAMQVIFHTVEQLKALKMEEMLATTTMPSSSGKPAQQEPETNTTPLVAAAVEMTTLSSLQEYSHEGETSPLAVVDEETVQVQTEVAPIHEEPVEQNEETPEANYATPEIDHESPEIVHGTQETNHEVPEENQEEEVPSMANLETATTAELPTMAEAEKPVKKCSSTPATIPEDPKEKPTVDGIVEEIYEIVKPTSTIVLDVAGETTVSKSSSASVSEKVESLEDEEDETRFTLLGEKVAQVPRPSLISYLRRAKVPVSASLEQLAMLYDALSKDARKQGFGKYAGYSDEVLQILQMSAEGGVAPQMKTLLAKVLERNELSREDAKVRTKAAIRDLDDPGSVLSKDLRRLLPLRYTI